MIGLSMKTNAHATVIFLGENRNSLLDLHEGALVHGGAQVVHRVQGRTRKACHNRVNVHYHLCIQ